MHFFCADVPVFKPANGETVLIPTKSNVVVDVSVDLVKKCAAGDPSPGKRKCPFNGTLIYNEKRQSLVLTSPVEAMNELKVKPHFVKFTSNCPSRNKDSVENAVQKVFQLLEK